jgi:hypothetical protein
MLDYSSEMYLKVPLHVILLAKPALNFFSQRSLLANVGGSLIREALTSYA